MEFNTRLIKGDDEPIYLPADAEVPYNKNRLRSWLLCQRHPRDFALVYCREARRELVDFGYWYCPDGRDARTQKPV